MKKILFACDLDNTLIHSHRYRQDNDICTEIYDGREQSFISQNALKLLEKILSSNVCFLPVTTRSIEQYRRITFPVKQKIPHALVSNGGILLSDNVADTEWHRETEMSVQPYKEELESIFSRYREDSRFTSIRIVDDMFLFFGFPDSKAAETFMTEIKTETSLNTQISGRKVYIFPDTLNKGTAVLKYKEKYNYDFLIAAGDSSIDIPMLSAADMAVVPDKRLADMISCPDIRICDTDDFAEYLLYSCREYKL